MNPAAFAGVTGEGRPTLGLAYLAARRAAEPIENELEPWQRARAWQQSAHMLVSLTQMAIADAGRMAKSAQIFSYPGAGWIRVARTPCCSRCAILAGRLYKATASFDRHPNCDCDSIPVHQYADRYDELREKGLFFDVKDYFDSLDEKTQNKIFTVSGAEAIRDGADPNLVVNARRGMRAASGEPAPVYTDSGAYKRGWAAQYLKEAYNRHLYMLPEELVSGPRGRRTRLMPEEIYRRAGDDRDAALMMLHQHGYLRDATPRLDGDLWGSRDDVVKAATARASIRLERGVRQAPQYRDVRILESGRTNRGYVVRPLDFDTDFHGTFIPPRPPSGNGPNYSGDDEWDWLKNIQVEDGAQILEKEWPTIEFLAKKGKKIVWLRETPAEVVGGALVRANPDALIDLELSDLKEITGSGSRTIHNRLRGGKSQAPNIYLEISKTPLELSTVMDKVDGFLRSPDSVGAKTVRVISLDKGVCMLRKEDGWTREY